MAKPFSTDEVLRAVRRDSFTARGGRPTMLDLGYFNLEWADRGIIVAVGWPGQWAASFVRDEAQGLRITAGQELTHFRLLPGEELRGPRSTLLFWGGDWIDSQNPARPARIRPGESGRDPPQISRSAVRLRRKAWASRGAVAGKPDITVP